MKPIDIVIVVILGVAVAAIIGYLVYKKINGKGGDCGCGCGCTGCPNANSCGGSKQKNGEQSEPNSSN